MLFPILGPSSLPVVVAQPDERNANRTASVLEWYDRHRVHNIWFKRKRRQSVFRLAHQFLGISLLEAARVLLCLAFIVFSLRILSMFIVNEQLGPKLLMVRRMVSVEFRFS